MIFYERMYALFRGILWMGLFCSVAAAAVGGWMIWKSYEEYYYDRLDKGRDIISMALRIGAVILVLLALTAA